MSDVPGAFPKHGRTVRDGGVAASGDRFDYDGDVGAVTRDWY